MRRGDNKRLRLLLHWRPKGECGVDFWGLSFPWWRLSPSRKATAAAASGAGGGRRQGEEETWTASRYGHEEKKEDADGG